MPSVRSLAVGLALALLLPGTMSGQAGRGFRDAWFWGVKVGGLSYDRVSADPDIVPSGIGQAPLTGVEWLITRTKGGLLVSVSQAFLSQQTVIASTASPGGGDTTFSPVDLRNVRRIDMALMAFPGNHILIHPYVGLGFSLRTVGATPLGPFVDDGESDFVASVVQESKTAVAPLLVAGGQYRLSWASVFAQTTISPSNANWILYNGRAVNFSYEFGIRYNIGSSIER